MPFWGEHKQPPQRPTREQWEGIKSQYTELPAGNIIELRGRDFPPEIQHASIINPASVFLDDVSRIVNHNWEPNLAFYVPESSDEGYEGDADAYVYFTNRYINELVPHEPEQAITQRISPTQREGHAVGQQLEARGLDNYLLWTNFVAREVAEHGHKIHLPIPPTIPRDPKEQQEFEAYQAGVRLVKIKFSTRDTAVAILEEWLKRAQTKSGLYLDTASIQRDIEQIRKFEREEPRAIIEQDDLAPLPTFFAEELEATYGKKPGKWSQRLRPYSQTQMRRNLAVTLEERRRRS